MFSICQEEISKEIREADYLSEIADETSDVSNIFQMAIVFRYIVKGKPVERFWDFLTPLDHDAKSLSSVILTDFEKHIKDNKNKLIAQTYDGAAVMSGSSNGVQAIVKRTYEHAAFIHFYAHQLNLKFEETIKAYPFFDPPKIQTELNIIYETKEFRTISGILQLYDCISHNSDLCEVFSESLKLLKILITIPMASAEAERCFSTLKRIKNFLRTSMSQERLSALAMLSKERDLIEKGEILLEDIELSEEREISEGEMLSEAIELSEKREIKEAEILAGDIDVSEEKKIPEEEILSYDRIFPDNKKRSQ
ncbi:unnamed protein product [Brassicogethes aeneus]|uniref:HAT C-terminal dimerisation domain-containing protein n=1 Tax=Brassicogethes aeneus TaxID=1431903 RepID=A0A9P0AQJ3_BRAAE|nr:unnamed protein product [Brassicogethes aeneus]